MEQKARRQIGILGGTFDPVHIGHMILAETIRSETKLDQVIFVPCQIPPHKTDEVVTDAEHRLTMVRLAILDESGLDVSDIEMRARGVSYTFNTLTGIKKQHKTDADFYFIMGADSVFTIESWYEAEALLGQFRFIVGNRPGYQEQAIVEQVQLLNETYGAQITIVAIPDTDVSSTQIRSLIRAGDKISGLVPEKVERYITEHGLYR